MAIRLTTGDRVAETSSKGNQEKWMADGRWYKLDLFGYEGLAETVSSALLQKTNVEALGFRFVRYRMERLNVHRRERNGCSSPNFLQLGEAILTLSDLLWKGIGHDWQRILARQPNMAAKIQWIAKQTAQLTGLDRFGEYLTLLFEVDMLFGNEDRHMNNIAVLRRGEGFAYCPIFDFGAGLLSNVREYSMEIQPRALLRQLLARPLNTTFPRQVSAARSVYGPQLQIGFAPEDVAEALAEPLEYYAERDRAYLADRVETCIHVMEKKLKQR